MTVLFDFFISHPLGVAETNMAFLIILLNSLKFKGRLSKQLGNRKPYSTSVSFRLLSVLNIPSICGTVM
jgi:hypothetical protein